MRNYDAWKLDTPAHYDEEPTLECAHCKTLVFETNNADLCEECQSLEQCDHCGELFEEESLTLGGFIEKADWLICKGCLKERNEREIDFSSFEIDGIDRNDYPDFCDAYIASAKYDDGEECTDADLEKLNDEQGELIHGMVQNILF